MHQKLLIVSLAFLAACGRAPSPETNSNPEGDPPKVSDPLPKETRPLPPTATTAILFNGSFDGGAELRTLDLETREQRVILQAPAIGSDAIVRTFGKTLYIVARDYQGMANTLTVLSPDDGYALACPDCEWPLGDGTNVQDLWAVSATKAYYTTLPDLLVGEYPHRNEVIVINPLTGAIATRIDVGAALSALGDSLPTDDPDGAYELGALYADSAHLFVALNALSSYQVIPKADAPCGVVAGRVAVIDLATDEVVKIIALSGSNPSPSPARFVEEPGTNNVLIATPGSLGTAEVDACGGIERVDRVALALGAPFATEAQLGGSVMSFDLDADGNGAVFLFTGGDYLAPTYEVRRFRAGAAPLDPALAAPGAKGFSQPSFVKANGGVAFVGLPLRDSKQVASFMLSDGTKKGDPIALDLPPIDVAFYPGTAYVR